ncbi:MAG: efflux RND transporter permease subunit [Bacteroidota bacterium]
MLVGSISAGRRAVGQVVQVLQGNNLNIPGGDIASGGRSFNIKTSGSFKGLDEIRETVIMSDGNNLVYLKDIAAVDYDLADVRWEGRYRGKKAIFINLTQKAGINVVKMAEEIDEKLGAFQAELPQGLELVTVFEQAPAVESRINDFAINLMQGVGLVGVIIFLFLGWRPSLVIMTVIPLSIVIAIAMLDQAGYGLQQISIAALVIALGLLVDNGIVVVENIVRFRKEGFPLVEAAAKGTAEVGYAIVSSTATTLLAFFPLVFLNSGAGEFLRSLPLTVIFVLFISLLLALTFTPIMAGKTLSARMNKERALDRRIRGFIEKVYRPVLDFSLKRGIIVLAASIAMLMGAASLFPSIGVSFFPTADKPMLLVEVEAPRGTSLDQTDEAMKFVEQVLDTTGFVKDYVSNTGHGNPMVYYNRRPEPYKKYFGQFLVNFNEWNPEQFYATLAQLRKDFAKYPSANITFSELKNGPPFEAPIEIKILGDELDTLRQISSKVENLIRSTSGTANVYNPLGVDKTDLKVEVNRDKAGMLGLAIPDIDLAVRASLTGLNVDEVTTREGERYDLVVRMPADDDLGIEDFYKVYFTSNTGAQVPLQQVANLRFEAATAEIQHYDLDRSTAVTADVLNADQTTQVTETIIEQLEKMEWPEGYGYYVAGEYEAQQETFGDLGTLLIVAMLGIFAVLVLQFRSLRQPLVVFSAIPMAVTGSFVALYLTGWSFSFFAFVGFISLVGIVVNNSIILVDYTNQLRAEGMELVDAIRKSCETRFTPILLTTTTTILGLLPLTLSQTNLWSPLGWTIIGGMVSSTLLTLLVVPVLLKWLTPSKQVVG